MNLRELDELCSALEDKGLYREADVLHAKFVKESQMMQKPSFSGMLSQYAPTFLKLLAVVPTRAKYFGIPTFNSEEKADNVSLVQELLMKSDYVKDKTGLKVNGVAGPNTLRIMDDLRLLLNKILFDAFAKKFKITDKKGQILTIENFKSF